MSGWLGRALGLLLGYALVKWLGALLILPCGVAAACGWALYRLVRGVRRAMVPASATTVGHATWVLVGGMLLHRAAAVAVDVAVMFLGAAWLLAWPSWAAVGVMVAYETVSTLLSAKMVAAGQFGANAWVALGVHSALRAAAVVAMVLGVRAVRAARRRALEADLIGESG
jgi:hypothetical protein